MLYLRTSADTAPVGAEAKRVLRLSRRASDDASATDSAIRVIMAFTSRVEALLVDLAHILTAASVTYCRAPPAGVK